MNFITKQSILQIIQEEFEISEMPRNLDWADVPLDNPVTINIDDIQGIPVNAVDPKTKEPLEPGMVKAYLVRQSPTGMKMINFPNMENGKRETRYIIVDDNLNPIKGMKFLPRNTSAGTDWKGVDMEKRADQKIARLQRKQSTYGHQVDDPELRQQVKSQDEMALLDAWAKRRLVHPILSEFFSRRSIIQHLDKCGIPEVKGGAKFTEPTTNILKKYNFNGPMINFSYHSVRDDKDIQDALDKIISYRTALETGEKMKGSRPEPTKMVRQYGGNVYPGGKWDPTQRAEGKNQFKLTPVYKLYMKNVQRGEMAFNVLTNLQVMGSINNGQYTLAMQFVATKSFRAADTEFGERTPSRMKLFEPIKVVSTKPLPPNDNTPTIKEDLGFFEELFADCLNQLGSELLSVDPNEVLQQLMFEPEDVISDRPNNNI